MYTYFVGVHYYRRGLLLFLLSKVFLGPISGD